MCPCHSTSEKKKYLKPELIRRDTLLNKLPNTFEDTDYFRLLSMHAETWHLGGSAATEELLARIESPQQTSLLEIGCGNGKTLHKLRNRGIERVMAVDASPQMLQSAADTLLSSSELILLNRADAHWLPAADACFDVVLIESVLIFCDPKTVLAEANRVLKPGGMLLLNELVVLNDIIVEHVQKIDDFISSPLLTLFTEAEWQAAFRETGFEVTWQMMGHIPRLKLFVFLHTLGLVDAVQDEAVLTYGLYQLTVRTR